MTDEQELRESIGRAARDGCVNCKALLGMAKEEGVSPAVLGRLCNEMKLKIHNCQLGCFK